MVLISIDWLRRAVLMTGMVCAGAMLLHPARASGEEIKAYELDNEVVCKVNTEAISKRDVEERMDMVAVKLNYFKKQMEAAKKWTPDIEKQWMEQYAPAFRDSLKKLVRERLMLQYAKQEKMQRFDERAFQRRYSAKLKEMKTDGSLAGLGMTPGELEKRMREMQQLDMFRGQFMNQLEAPKKPEVQKYYTENISRYQRKAGARVSLIRIDRFVSDPASGRMVVREKSLDLAEELRKDIVEYGADFREVAKTHSDDLAARERGGLVILDKDAFFDPESYNPQLAAALRGLKPGEISKVFEFGQTSWAFARVEERREAGDAPLDGELYDEIYNTLMRAKSTKREDEWFRKALSKSLVTHVVGGVPKSLPIDYFFPEDKKDEKEKPKVAAPGPVTNASGEETAQRRPGPRTENAR